MHKCECWFNVLFIGLLLCSFSSVYCIHFILRQIVLIACLLSAQYIQYLLCCVCRIAFSYCVGYHKCHFSGFLKSLCKNRKSCKISILISQDVVFIWW